MDINELLYRGQVSLANAASATCEPSRLAHEDLAQRYAARLIAAGFPHCRHTPSVLQRAHRREAPLEATARTVGDVLAMPHVVG